MSHSRSHTALFRASTPAWQPVQPPASQVIHRRRCLWNLARCLPQRLPPLRKVRQSLSRLQRSSGWARFLSWGFKESPLHRHGHPLSGPTPPRRAKLRHLPAKGSAPSARAVFTASTVYSSVWCCCPAEQQPVLRFASSNVGFFFLLETRPHLVATRCRKGCMSRSEEVPPSLKRVALQSVPPSPSRRDVTASTSLLAVTRLPFFAYAITERANTSRRWCSHKVFNRKRVRCSQVFPKKGSAHSILSWASEVVVHRRSDVSVSGQFLMRREARADRVAVKPLLFPPRANPVCLAAAARCRAPWTRGVSAVLSGSAAFPKDGGGDG